MKNIIGTLSIALYLFLSTGFLSCSKQTVQLQESDLIGSWRSKNMTINGQPASEYINGVEFYSYSLGLLKDNFYYLNYNTGEWKIENNELELSNWGTFKITSYSDSLFTVEAKVISSQIHSSIDGIKEDEIITITALYRRD